MGFSISFIAFKDLSRAEVLKRTGFAVTGAASDFPGSEHPFAFSAFPSGWAAVFSSDYWFAAAPCLSHLSFGATVLGCQFEEHIMYSAASLFMDGGQRWRVEHDSSKGLTDLTAEGQLPEQFGPIRTRLVAAQNAEKPGVFSADYVFDVPIDLVFALTGYRYDHSEFDWGRPHFEELRPEKSAHRCGT